MFRGVVGLKSAAAAAAAAAAVVATTVAVETCNGGCSGVASTFTTGIRCEIS